MPKTNRSPYAATFRTAVRNGTPASKAVCAIAKNNNTSTNTVYTSLYKAGVCNRQKCAGQWIYWPCDTAKPSTRNAKNTQAEIWQQVIDWCVVSGQYRPQQITTGATSQANFTSFCHRAIGRFNNGTPATAATKRTATKRTATKRTTARTGTRKRTAKPATRTHARTHTSHKATSYKFPHTATAKRYRRAA